MFPYRIVHSSASTRGLRCLSPHEQRAIDSALTMVAKEAGSSAGADGDDVQFAGGIQLAGAWVAWALEHDEQKLIVLTVEPDADAERSRPLPVAA